jgi:acyl dehydratase
VSAPDLYYEDVELGDEIGPVRRTVTDEQVAAFINLWREEAPSRFTDPEIAKGLGLAGTIVPGAMNMAMMSQLITWWSPTVTLKKLDVVFRQVVLHNIPIQIKGIVTDKDIVDGSPQLECDVFMENEEGTRMVIGKATVGISSKA